MQYPCPTYLYRKLFCDSFFKLFPNSVCNFRAGYLMTCFVVNLLNLIRNITKQISQRRDIQRGNRHLDNLNFCVTRSTRHAKSSSQCRRNFIAKDRENAVRKVKIAFFLKMRYPWKFCSINYCRITVSDHFYWFIFIKSVNITFYFAKVCFFPYLLLIKIVKSTGWRFQMLIYKKQSSEWYKCLKI